MITNFVFEQQNRCQEENSWFNLCGRSGSKSRSGSRPAPRQGRGRGQGFPVLYLELGAGRLGSTQTPRHVHDQVAVPGVQEPHGSLYDRRDRLPALRRPRHLPADEAAATGDEGYNLDSSTQQSDKPPGPEHPLCTLSATEKSMSMTDARRYHLLSLVHARLLGQTVEAHLRGSNRFESQGP